MRHGPAAGHAAEGKRSGTAGSGRVRHKRPRATNLITPITDAMMD